MIYPRMNLYMCDLNRTALLVPQQQRNECKTNKRSERRHSGRQGLLDVNENTLMFPVWDGIRFSLL